MAGHSHWAGIKRKKGVIDAKRGRLFSRLARNIMSAARQDGGDVNANLQLRYAVEKAKAANMPADGIQRAIQKGLGELPGQTLEEITYEGYGPNGVAFLVEALTDNRNRTVPEIRRIFEGSGGSLGGVGSVAWMFEKKGLITIDREAAEEDVLMEIALDSGADDLETVGSSYEISTAPQTLLRVQKALTEKEIPLESVEFTQMPKSTIKLDRNMARRVLSLFEKLEDHEDVQNVYANFDISDEVMAEVAAT
jgi:YebC/PmpR family DNA-binding regulatory protein